MVALASVMDGPSSDAISREVEPALPTIFNMLSSSQSSRVRQATAWLISQMIKHAPAIFLNKQEHLKSLMEKGLTHI